MEGSLGHIDHVALHHLDGEDGPLLGVDVEEAAAMNDEADLVLGVPVLAAELGEQGVEVGDLGVDVDDVGGDVAALALEAADGLLVGGEDFVGGGIFGEGVGALEAAVPDAELFEEGPDGGGVLKDLTGVAECERCHAKILSRRGSKTGPSSLRWSALQRVAEWSSLRRFATQKSAPGWR